MGHPDDELDEHAQRRRNLLKKAGHSAAVGPAVTLLLGEGLKPKRAAAYATAPSFFTTVTHTNMITTTVTVEVSATTSMGGTTSGQF